MELLVLGLLFLDGLVMVHVGLGKLVGLVGCLFVELLDFEDLGSREAEVLQVFLVLLHVFKLGVIEDTKLLLNLIIEMFYVFLELS